MQRTAKNITWNATRVTWIGGLAFVLVLLATLGTGCNARDAAASAAPAERGRSAQVERGAYLVEVIGCGHCHTPWKMGPKGPEPDMARMLSGHPESYPISAPPAELGPPWGHGMIIDPTGTAFSGEWGVSFAANLTPDRNTGLGIWTEDMFVKAIRTGKHFGVSRPILPPMPWMAFRNMTDEDLKAVFGYLRTIPPVVNHVPDPIPSPALTH